MRDYKNLSKHSPNQNFGDTILFYQCCIQCINVAKRTHFNVPDCAHEAQVSDYRYLITKKLKSDSCNCTPT